MNLLTISARKTFIRYVFYRDFENNKTHSSTCSGHIENVESQNINGIIICPLDQTPLAPLSIKEKNHAAALCAIVDEINKRSREQGLTGIDAIGYRVVHGGAYFKKSTRINAENIEQLKKNHTLAPHLNPSSTACIETGIKKYPEIQHIGVFDTAFHSSLPPKAFHYAIPEEWYEKHNIRRYGFNGISHQYISQNAIKKFNLDPNNNRLVIAHLGKECCVTALINGKSVNTTMGLTPLSGLMMGTHSGNVDPGMHDYLAKNTNLTLKDITDILHEKSGLLGLSGFTDDMCMLTEAKKNGDKKAQLTFEVFTFNLLQEIGRMLISLQGKPDLLIFTAGIGEHHVELREKVLTDLHWLGFHLCKNSNNSNGDELGRITVPDSPYQAIVMKTEIFYSIACDCYKLLKENKRVKNVS